MRMLSRWRFTPSCVYMYAYAMTIARKMQRQTTKHVVNHTRDHGMLMIMNWKKTGINYLRTVNAVAFMVFKFLLHDFGE